MASTLISTPKPVRTDLLVLLPVYHGIVANGSWGWIHPDEEPLYRCPNQKCASQSFKTLTAAIGHLESEKCGAMRPGTVAKLLRELLTGKGPIRC
jgi:hypothetical protein